MSTDTLRSLCDAMDALDGAFAHTANGFTADTIARAQSVVVTAMQTVVDDFEVAPDVDAGHSHSLASQLENEYEQGYADGLVAADTGREAEMEELLAALWIESKISRVAWEDLTETFADAAPGEKIDDVFDTASTLHAAQLMSDAAYGEIVDFVTL